MYAKILVPIDGSATSERGLREAIELATRLKSQLVLLHVVDPYPVLMEMASVQSFEDTRQRLLKFGEETLEKARQRASESGVASESVVRETSAQRAADAIVDEAAKRQCQLIVMGTHGRRGLSRVVLGSDAELVLRLAPVPVLLVRQPEGKS